MKTTNRSLVWALLLTFGLGCRTLVDTTGCLALLVLDVCLLAVLVYRQSNKATAFTGSPFVLMMAAYLGLLLFNTVVSQAPYYSSHDAALIMVLPLAFLAFVHNKDHSAARSPIQYLWPAAVIACLAIAQTIVEGVRAQATFLDINSLATFLYMVLLPTMGHLMVSRRHWLNWPFLCALCLALAAADSRGAYLVTVIAASALTVLGLYWRLPPKRVLAVILVAGLSTLLGTKTIAVARDFTFLKTIEAPAQTFRDDAVSVKSRLRMWQSAIRAYETEAPYLGTGLGTYKLVYPQYRDPNEKYTSGDQAHNDYVQWLLEGGPLLLLAFVVVVVLIPAFLLIRCLRAPSPDRWRSWQSISLLITCLAAAGHALINFVFKDPAIALLFGSYLAVAASHSAASRLEILTRYKLARFINVAVIIAGCLLTLNLGINTTIEVLLGKDKSVTFDRSMQQTYSIAAVGHLLSPSNPYALNALSYLSLKQAIDSKNDNEKEVLFRSAYADTQLWIASNKREPFAWLRAAKIAEERRDISGGMGPEDFLRIASLYDPPNLLVNAELGKELLRTGRIRESCETLRQGEKWVPIAISRTWVMDWADQTLLACKDAATIEELRSLRALATGRM